MGGFAVNDGGDAHGGVVFHPFPHFHDVSAGRIHDLDSLFLQRVHEGGGNAEGGNDHHVVRDNLIIRGVQMLPGKFFNALPLQLAVYLRIVDDVADQVNLPVREDLARRIGDVDGAADAVAESEFPGQEEFRMAQVVHIARGADVGNQFALVMLLDFLLHQFHHLGASHVHSGFAG